MANWEAKKVSEIIQSIDEDLIVLPVIQRNLVWDEEKMELLFDSLLKGNSFGGIMALEEKNKSKPLFSFRKFSRDGAIHDSSMPSILDRTTKLIIDGQQRLQAFYMGLLGGINGKTLYLNLYSNEDYDFEFSHQEADLYRSTKDDNETEVSKLWYPVKTLYNQLEGVIKDEDVAKEIIKVRGITEEVLQDLIRANVGAFWKAVFSDEAVGISIVPIDKRDPNTERRRMVELFRRLNDGGTRLSALDLAASILKGLDDRLEIFLRREIPEFEDMGIHQDEVIKLLFLLRNDPNKEITDIGPDDANFAYENKERLIKTLKVLRQLLRDADLYEYFNEGSRSVIPLYFVAYHIFHKDVSLPLLGDLYINHDTNNADFINIKRWLYLSILNGVFSRGKGWIPYKTGIRKILGIIRDYKNCLFPAEEIFSMYEAYGLNFGREISFARLPHWDLSFVFYLMYGCRSKVGRDIDHVQPRSLLEERGIIAEKIHSPANYQLLDEERNRNDKRAKELKQWFEGWNISVRDNYLERHLIPQDSELWSIEKFDAFLSARSTLIVEKIQSLVPQQSIPSQPAGTPTTQGKPVLQNTATNPPFSIDKVSLKEKLSKKYHEHSILNDLTTWENIFKKTGCGKLWTGRYRNELALSQIFTIADFALLIMALGVKFSHKDKFGLCYVFINPLSNGKIPHLQTKNFGGWAWGVALSQLEMRGFDWKEFLKS